MLTFRTGNDLDLDVVLDLYHASTLGERRPVDDRARMGVMLRSANLVITAWEGDLLVGISRSLTDGTYCTYLADLAVRASHQKQGIGRELILKTRDAVPDAMLILLAAPKARTYYPHIGMEHFESAWVLRRATSCRRDPPKPERYTFGNVTHRLLSMNYRPLGRTGWNVSDISFGAWAIGGAWGTVSDDESMAALHAAVDAGVNFIDTADVYGDGRSERLIARLKRERAGQQIVVATKAGRRLPKQVKEGYTCENLTAWVERSLTNLEMDSLDLLQLHCPPTDVYYMPEVFGVLDDLVKAGKLKFYGVSVERVEEALKAIEYPAVQSVQIIFNCFRLRPADVFFPLGKQRKVGILARVPLASGLLTGKINRDTAFAADDHRNFNRQGQAFDVGETFSGVDFEVALKAVEEIRGQVPAGVPMASFALRWILMHDAVTCAIPGGKRPSQVQENCRASDLPALSETQMKSVQGTYDRLIKPLVHQRW
ncbi:MAG: aldo/keto reductase [Tepidisphaeraceae bacterium]